MLERIKRALKTAQFYWHRKVLKDDFLIDIDEIDPWTGGPFDFAPTADMIWNPMTGELLSPEEINYLLTADFDVDDEEIII